MTLHAKMAAEGDRWGRIAKKHYLWIAEAAEPSDLGKSIRGVPMAYRSQSLGVVVIYHPGTPQDTSGTALDSPGQLVGGFGHVALLDHRYVDIGAPILQSES